MGLLDKYFVPADEVKFIGQTLADYREIRKIYNYEYTPEDLKALQACAKDLRPFTWSCVPAGVTFWLSGKLISTRGRGAPFRASVGVLRVLATGQVFRLGYLAGSYRQTTKCMKSLVSLPTPLGGEMVALIQQRNPNHPYLKYERRPPGLEYSDERPRIATDANRLAQIAKFKKELATAKGGVAVRRGEGEALEGLIQQQGDTLSSVVNAAEEYEERRRHRHGAFGAAGGAVGGAGKDEGVVSGPKGLVITDGPPAPGWDTQQAASAAAAPAQHTAAAVGGERQGAAGGAGGDIFADVLGWGEGEGPGGLEQQKAAEQQARRERRRDRWGRLRRRREPAAAAVEQAPEEGDLMEGSD